MELKRKIYDKLLSWKKDCGKTALLIEGARRIGKSTIVSKFGHENYKSCLIIDFAKTSSKIKAIFNDDLDDLDLFFQNLSLETKTRFYHRDTLIVFDEVQRFPRAREAIKYLVQDGRYDFIETGSLISIKNNVKNIVIPSEEKRIKMYPLDFEEFLWAANEDLLSEYIQTCVEQKKPLIDSLHRKAMRLFYEYMLVGGMPKCVVAYFSNNRDFYAADEEKRLILDLYKDDIAKADKNYQFKVKTLFDNIPGYLSTHEKKISLNQIQSNSKYSNYEEAFFYLQDSMITNNCYKCNDPNVGFSLNKNVSEVKSYMGDTGLLISHAFSENEIVSSNLYKNIIDGKLSLNKGMLLENVIAQMIVSTGRQLYFYSRYSLIKKRNDIEIDFLISNDSKTQLKIYPIEVKLSKNYTNISFDKFKTLFKKRIDKGFVVHPKQASFDGNVYKIPPYMFYFFIRR